MDKIKQFFSILKIRDFFSILEKKQQNKFLILIFLIFFNAVLEMIGIGIIFPFLKLITQENYNFLGINIYSNNGNLNYFIVLVFGIIFFYFIKNIISSLIAYQQSNFIFNILFSLSSSLYTYYLHRPYNEFLNDSTSRLIKNTLNETRNATDFYIKPILIFFSELLLIIILTSFLIIIEPVGSFLILTLFLIFFFFYNYLSKNIVNNWGLNSHLHEQKRLKLLQEGFGSIKSILLRNHQEYFIKIYNKSTSSQMQSNKLQDFVLTILKFWLEFILILGVFCFILFEIYSMNSISQIKEMIPKIGLFIIAALRLLPSLNRIQGSIQNINFSKTFIENIINEKRKGFKTKIKKYNEEIILNNETVNFIELKNVSFNYNIETKSNNVFSNMNIIFRKGEISVIYGPSGSGKSTLIDIVLGLIKPISGMVCFNNQSIDNNIEYWQKKISFVPQNIFLLDDTIKNNIIFFEKSENIKEEKINKLLSICKLDDLLSERGENFKIGENGINISGGQKQKISIARSLFCNPELLILDEPTSALDKNNSDNIFKLLNSIKKNVIVIIISHDKEIISKCDKLINLEKIK